MLSDIKAQLTSPDTRFPPGAFGPEGAVCAAEPLAWLSAGEFNV
jgi:hypothetical protein